MRLLYLDLGMGAAGDMLCAALYELLDDKGQKRFLDRVGSLGLDGVLVSAERTSKCGINGTHMCVLVDGVSEDAHRDHDHAHDHHHEHSDLHTVSHIIDSLPVSDTVKKDAASVFGLIAEAESHVHSVPVSDIHFHEVGTKDAIADVVMFCMLIEILGIDKVIASPVTTGFGKVKCAHGILPVPAPATAHLLRGIPATGGSIEGELCTPTGAAIIRHFADVRRIAPVMTAEKIGYGMGYKDFEAANCVRAFLCTEEPGDEVVILSCNIDDMTGEAIGYAMSKLFDEGALDVYTVPIGMKKSRPGTMLNVLCFDPDTDRFVSLIFKHTTTLGIRKTVSQRYTLARRTDEIKSSLGTVHIKRAEGYGVSRQKYEFDDIASIADSNGISLYDVISRIESDDD